MAIHAYVSFSACLQVTYLESGALHPGGGEGEGSVELPSLPRSALSG